MLQSKISQTKIKQKLHIIETPLCWHDGSYHSRQFINT